MSHNASVLVRLSKDITYPNAPLALKMRLCCVILFEYGCTVSSDRVAAVKVQTFPEVKYDDPVGQAIDGAGEGTAEGFGDGSEEGTAGEGSAEGLREGIGVDTVAGCGDGGVVMTVEGIDVGIFDGCGVGAGDGSWVGVRLGMNVGSEVGSSEGSDVGSCERAEVGSGEGNGLGTEVGVKDGAMNIGVTLNFIPQKVVESSLVNIQ